MNLAVYGVVLGVQILGMLSMVRVIALWVSVSICLFFAIAIISVGFGCKKGN